MSDLILTKPLKKGDKKGQVKLIQEWLSLHDERVAIDGDFGSATDSAVQDFQANSKLEVTGTVNQATFDALILPMTKAVTPIPANGKTLGEMVVAYANQHLSQHPQEVGGQNRGPWVRLYMNLKRAVEFSYAGAGSQGGGSNCRPRRYFTNAKLRIRHQR